jgi:Caspase domain/Glucodextranase, domain B
MQRSLLTGRGAWLCATPLFLALTVLAVGAAPSNTQSGCDATADTMRSIREKLRSAQADADLEDLLQKLKYVTGECPNDGDAWYFRAKVEQKLGKSFNYSMNQAQKNRSQALRDGVDPFSSSTPANADRPSQTPPAAPDSDFAPQIEIISPPVSRGQSARIKTCQITIKGQAVDRSAIERVTINNTRVEVDAQGNFSGDVNLKPGGDLVKVTATNAAGKSASRDFTLVCDNQSSSTVATNSTSAASPSASTLGSLVTVKQYALVIGINNYRHLGKLNTAVNDAQEVARVLRDLYGFEVKLLTDAGRAEIVTALNEYQQRLDERTRLLIYYAGHGIFDKTGEKAYWLPVDADKNNDVNWIMADEVTVKLKRIPSRHVLIVSDSCYSGAMSRDTATGLTAPAERSRYLLKSGEGMSRVLMASGGNEPVSDSGGGAHSVFAAALLRGLREMKEPVFTAEELFRDYILEWVTGRSDQKPEYNQVRNSGHEGGDFIFVRRPSSENPVK